MKRFETNEAGWLQPPAVDRGLSVYLAIIRERLLLVVATVVVTTVVAVGYVATADEVYEAETEIRLSPISDQEGALLGLGLITQSNDPQRAIQTAVTLIESDAAAESTAEQLGVTGGADAVLDDVSVAPVAESDIIILTAEGPNPRGAAELANTFAEAAIQHRTDVLHEGLDGRLRGLQEELDATSSAEERASLLDMIGLLSGLRRGSDPTLELIESATPPGGPVSPKRTASIAAGLLAGLLLGIGAAFAQRMLDPRLRREEQLRERFQLPILARIPRVRAARRSRMPLTNESVPASVIEAYRTLRAILARPLARGDGPASILVTSAGPSEGKTTTAINLATSLAQAGHRVILVEADLRRPMIAEALGIRVRRGITRVLIEEATLRDSLVPAPDNPNLQLLLAEPDSAWGSELLSQRVGERLVAQAKQLADYVIIDSPPLATVVDALPVASTVDDVLLVARLGVSRTDGIQKLAEILADVGIRPAGFAVVGTPAPSGKDYYGEQRRMVATRETAARAVAE